MVAPASSNPAADNIESQMRLRLEAKEAIVQAIVEHRIAEAANTKIQQYSQEELSKLAPYSSVDIWREPDSKDQSGWHRRFGTSSCVARRRWVFPRLVWDYQEYPETIVQRRRAHCYPVPHACQHGYQVLLGSYQEHLSVYAD